LAIYSYKCVSCGTYKDIIRGISEPEDSYECDNCSSNLTRVYDIPGVRFNGNGFYSTDK